MKMKRRRSRVRDTRKKHVRRGCGRAGQFRSNAVDHTNRRRQDKIRLAQTAPRNPSAPVRTQQSRRTSCSSILPRPQPSDHSRARQPLERWPKRLSDSGRISAEQKDAA